MKRGLVAVLGLALGGALSLGAQGCCTDDLNVLSTLKLHAGEFEWHEGDSKPRDLQASDFGLVFSGSDEPVELHYVSSVDGRAYTVRYEITEVFTTRVH